MRRVFLLLALMAAVVALGARVIVAMYARQHVWHSIDAAQATNVAIVFGAGVRNGLPTAMLYDRVAAATELYKLGKVETLLMSGENAGPQHDETEVMRRTALQLGVPEKDIMLDGNGLSTFDTCLRARDVFGLRGQRITLVTQTFHLDRAVFVCNALGMPAEGYPADLRPYTGVWFNQLREIPATVKAIYDIAVWRAGGFT